MSESKGEAIKAKGVIVKCNECGKIVSGRVPKNGDGSLWLPKWHKDNEGKPCSGRFEEATIIETQKSKL